MRLRIELSAALVLLTAATAAAQQPNCYEPTVLVTFRSIMGNVRRDVSPSRVRAELGGKRVSISSIVPLAPRKRAVLLLDASGSMNDDHHLVWPAVVGLAETLARSAPEDTQLAMLTFWERSEDRVDFTDGSRDTILDRLQTYLKDPHLPHGRSPILKGIDHAVQMLSHPKTADAIYLVSDGRDNFSKETIKQARRELMASAVRLFAILVEPPENPGVIFEERAGPKQFVELAEQTGGWAVSSSARLLATDQRTRGEVNSAVGFMLQHQLFQITLALSGRREKSDLFKLQLVDAKGKPEKQVLIHYPHMLQPCSIRSGQ